MQAFRTPVVDDWHCESSAFVWAIGQHWVHDNTYIFLFLYIIVLFTLQDLSTPHTVHRQVIKTFLLLDG